MEKRIKILYIITIMAILAFLGMQMYWMHGRYEFSLKEYERNLSEQIIESVDNYNEIRVKTPESSLQDTLHIDENETISLPSFSLKQDFGDTVAKTSRKVSIYTYTYNAYDLLGIERGEPLSDEQKAKAIAMAQTLSSESNNIVDADIFDASGAKDENEAWIASKNYQIERKIPFTSEGLDSVLRKEGIKADIIIAKADSTIWKTDVKYQTSVFKPVLSMTIPYSQFEGRFVTLKCRISPFSVLPDMWRTLLISMVISTLLIICLLMQFSTVLKLSRLDKMRNSFMTTMIHELKRPISTLMMCVSGLDNDRLMEEKDTKKEIISETRTALDNLSAYFSKLRDITFNNVEQIPLNIQNINLHDLFDAVAVAIDRNVDKDIVMINDIAKDIELSADRTHLYNVINNLVENAIKYSGSSVVINAHAIENNNVVELKISDNGNGIPSADLKHIFKRFYRGEASIGEQPGMGLGLAYVKLLIDAHGGDISVDSSVGEGTSFTIILPQ
ncbi:MAG: HAMP domain-containing histidine kinase [Muribaculaceae bacterium]|nr:HAMP domain-containing histidine kinase [Muribaculaceae bacterium]